MNTQTKLIRAPLDVPLWPIGRRSARQQLKEDSLAVLDYRIIDSPEDDDRSSEASMVSKVFDDLEIHPFTQASVVAFMAEKRAAANQGLVDQNLQLQTASCRNWRRAAIVLSLVCAISVIATLSSKYAHDEIVLFTASIMFCSLLVGTLVCWKNSFRSLRNFYDFPSPVFQYGWQRQPLVGYQGQIPEHAIDMAIRLKRRLPAAQFYVYELGFDPLFEIEILGQRHFFAQWDEPGFFSERRV